MSDDRFANTKWDKHDVAFNREIVAGVGADINSAIEVGVQRLQHARIVAESQKDSTALVFIDTALERLREAEGLQRTLQGLSTAF